MSNGARCRLHCDCGSEKPPSARSVVMPIKKTNKKSPGMSSGEREAQKARRWQQVLFIAISILVLLSMLVSLTR